MMTIETMRLKLASMAARLTPTCRGVACSCAAARAAGAYGIAGSCGSTNFRETRHGEDRADKDERDGQVTAERQPAYGRGLRQGNTRCDQRERRPQRAHAVQRGFLVAGFERERRLAMRRFERGQGRAQHREHDAEREENQQRAGLDLQLRLQRSEVTGAEIAAEVPQPVPGKHAAERDAEGCAQGADERAFEHEQARELRPRHSYDPQQRKLRAAPEQRKELCREHQEGAGKQRDEREHVEIDAISARKTRAAFAFRLGRCDEHAGRQQALERNSEICDVRARLELHIDPMELAYPTELPLSACDVHDRKALARAARGQDIDHAQPRRCRCRRALARCRRS